MLRNLVTAFLAFALIGSSGVAIAAPPANPGNSASAPGQVSRPIAGGAAQATEIEVPSDAKETGRGLVKDVGVPDFVQLPATSAAPSQGDSAPGNSESAPGQGGSSPGNSGDTPANNKGVGAGLADLTPPGLVRKLDTPAAAKAKFAANVDAGCKAVLDGVSNPECDPKTYIIRYKVGSDMEAEAKGLATRVAANLSAVIPGLAAVLDATELAELSQYSTVLSIEEDQEISISTVQADAVWGLDRLDEPTLPGDSTFEYSQTGLGVDVFVVDTGVLPGHDEFSGRVTSGYSSIDDGNGTLDCNGHGTHVAGTIAGVTYGVAKGATVVPVRVLGCDGSGTLSGVIAGLSWISQIYDGSPAVVNMSLGGGASASLDAAVQTLIDKGITVVAAAGNSTADACTASPARVSGAITVAASTAVDAIAAYSNFGSCVDLIAPGSAIKSAYYTSSTATATLSGTSMAAPHVAGVVAQLLETQASTPADVSLQLTSGASKDVVTGDLRGTPNLLLQLVNAATAPDAEAPEADNPVAEPDADSPASPVVKTKPSAPGQAKVKTKGPKAEVSWTVPPLFANSIDAQYLRLYAFGEFVSEIEVEPGVTTVVVDGLELGLGYSATLVLENEFGRSPESLQSATFRPRPLQKPSEGEFSAWVKKISDTQVKFYVKFPQVGEKIQFMVQNAAGAYEELAWLRIEADDLNESGQYASLTNAIYFIRTLDLKAGKNRLRILVDGVQIGQTRTYSK